ncbi:hypothetical protein AX774_g6302 [Zancudomyces culisetae]|uniref:Uncharacterized protein n=1 Tax=Zancudomyces culisetae TaxID=1213189 RepID=A0A1R1PH45_ZANCU|nr:hypothetical protein AX774_g6302 [Zancudomyces culisetae]|eukprot:OMH80268.1 hypothetical protein AX774_g6302 [Zancudomyces culisetae]
MGDENTEKPVNNRHIQAKKNKNGRKRSTLLPGFSSRISRPMEPPKESRFHTLEIRICLLLLFIFFPLMVYTGAKVSGAGNKKLYSEISEKLSDGWRGGERNERED